MSLLSTTQTIDILQRRIRGALVQMAFDIRQGTADEQLLYNAIFSDTTKFTLEEVCYLTFFYSVAPNDLRDNPDATDVQITTSVNGIKAELITRQKDVGRTVTGLIGYFSI